jgi:fucose 4-O-acetylase-like acetyltransferase
MNIFNTQHILKEKRWKWIDYDKGISIILVGFGHCLSVMKGHVDLDSYPIFNYIATFLYGFRMPLFFIISGIFISSGLKRKGLSGYVSNRADTVLYPLMVWGIIQITLQLITARISNNTVTPASYLYLLIAPRETGHFWYLNALFCIGVIYAFLRSGLKMKPLAQVGLGLILYCFSAYIHLNNLNAGFLTDICEFYLFFSLGDLISNVLLTEQNVKRFSSFKLFFPLLVIFLIIQYQFAKINLHGGAEGINYVEHKMPFFFLFEALFGCTISINFSFLLQKYNALKFLRVIGFHSLYIYCMQIIMVTVARVVLINVLKVHYVPALVILIWLSGIIIPIFIYNACMRLNMWWLFTFKRPDKQKAIAPEEPTLALKSA